MIYKLVIVRIAHFINFVNHNEIINLFIIGGDKYCSMNLGKSSKRH